MLDTPLTLHLSPIEKPKSWLLRFAYWMSRRQLGKVMTAMKILYARSPGFLLLQAHAMRFLGGLQLHPSLKHLLSIYVSRLNDCHFCTDLHSAQALLDQVPQAKIDALANPSTGLELSAQEKAALAYAEEILRTHRASQATFSELRAHFSERAIVEITWLVGYITSLNLTAGALGIPADGFCVIVREKNAMSATA